MKKLLIYGLVAVVVMVVLATVGGSFYMLDFALMPKEGRGDTAARYQEQFDTYPETRLWVDSLRSRDALRDTFVTMPNGERHHALYVNKGSSRTAVIVHGWRDCAIDFLYLGRIYEQLLGYNVVMPDLHAHGLSEGDRIICATSNFYRKLTDEAILADALVSENCSEWMNYMIRRISDSCELKCGNLSAVTLIVRGS